MRSLVCLTLVLTCACSERGLPLPGPAVEQLALGLNHSCGRFADGAIRCWGWSADLAPTAPTASAAITHAISLPLPRAAGLAAGIESTFVVLSDGTAQCWGAADSMVVPPIPGCGARPGVLPLAGVVEIAAGSLHACARVGDGRVLCWGDNHEGQSGHVATLTIDRPLVVDGIDDATRVFAGGTLTCALRSSGATACWGNLYPLGKLPELRLGTDIAELRGATQLAIGLRHACARMSDGTVRCWGANVSGQVGDGTFVDRDTPVPVVALDDVAEVAVGYRSSCARRASGEVRCWGNVQGYGGDVPGTVVPAHVLDGAVALGGAGVAHLCAGNSDGAVLCWGENDKGQLGDGTLFYRGQPVFVRF